LNSFAAGILTFHSATIIKISLDGFGTYYQGCNDKKEVWERTHKTIHFQKHLKLILKLVLNRVFTFIALQTKTRKKCENAFPHPNKLWERRSPAFQRHCTSDAV